MNIKIGDKVICTNIEYCIIGINTNKKTIDVTAFGFSYYNCDGSLFKTIKGDPLDFTQEMSKEDYIIKVIQAYKNGKKIEYKSRNSELSLSEGYIPIPNWNWGLYDYRIMEEKLIGWTNVYNSDHNFIRNSVIYDTKEEAFECRNPDLYVKTIKISEVDE